MVKTDSFAVAQIGYGYWGRNLARNADANLGLTLSKICDVNAENRDRAASAHPTAAVSADYREVVDDPNIDAVIVVTPASTHVEICQRALRAGKHVLVTKPLANSAETAGEIRDLADAAQRVLLVDHTFLYSPSVECLRQTLNSRELGRPLYYDAIRTGLGIFKSDANIIDDLAIHDIAILEYIFPDLPSVVSATAAASFSGLKENLTSITLQYSDGFVAHLAGSWLSPLKQRQVVLAGDAKMLVWDDGRPDSRIRIHDSGISLCEHATLPGRANVEYRQGEVAAVNVADVEALSVEMSDFVHCMRTGDVPRSSGARAARVMKVVAAAQRSASLSGSPVKVED